MGDDRSPWQETETAESVSAPAVEASRPARGVEDVLRIRWDTPRGRRVRSQVIRDIRFERSEHLPEILSELRGTDEVKGFLDLRFVKLDGENLNGTRLSGLDLTGASLAKAALVGADLRNARLVRARLVGAQLREADLSRATLADANLTEATLEGAVMVSANLERARCIATSLRRASLVGACLRGAMLVRAAFDDADLGGADAEGAHALAGAFAAAKSGPCGTILEVPVGGDGTGLPPRPVVDVARLERTRAGAFREPPPVPAEQTDETRKSWDFALASLIMRRARVSRVTVVVDGAEQVLFERA